MLDKNKPTIFILTAAFRDKGLGEVGDSIRQLTPLFNVMWFPVFDTVFGNWHAGAKYNHGLDMVSKILTRMTLAEAQNSWIYFLDDDNKIHPEFGPALIKAIAELDCCPERIMFVMSQVHSTGNMRLENPPVAQAAIDTGCIIPNAHCSLNPAVRWRMADNNGALTYDFYYINRIINQGRFTAINVPGLVYYNAITGCDTSGRGFNQDEVNAAIKLEEELYGPA